MAKAFGSDVEIQPLPVGAYLEFLVVLLAKAIGLQEDLGHISAPQLIAATARIGIGKDVDLAIAATEAHVERVLIPKHSHFGLALRIGVLALPIVTKRNRLRAVPFRFGGKRGQPFLSIAER